MATHSYCPVCPDVSFIQLYVGGRKLDYTVVEVKQDVMEKCLKDYVPKPLVLRKCAEMMEREGSQMDGSLYIGLYMRELIPFANSGRLEGMQSYYNSQDLEFLCMFVQP